jgi:hypothetical protein
MHIFRTWKYTREILTSNGHTYSVDEARKILNSRPRESVYFPIKHLRKEVDHMFQGQHFSDSRANLNVPIIIVTTKNNGEEVIDGWHRLEKALRLGYVALPAVRLNKSETERVRIKRNKCTTSK